MKPQHVRFAFLVSCLVGLSSLKIWSDDTVLEEPATESVTTDGAASSETPEEAVQSMDAEVAASEAASQEGQAYTILKGDTLWDLSAKFYRDPWLWKRIWKANQYVVNPDLIFYDKTLSIPGVPATVASDDRSMEQKAETQVSETAPEAASETAVAEEAPAPQASDETAVEEASATEQTETDEASVEGEGTSEEGSETAEAPTAASGGRVFSGDSFVAPRDWEFDGFITSERDQKLMISAGDTVYLDLGSQQAVKRDTRCLVYRKGRRVYHPTNGEFLGYVVRKVALVEVTNEVTDQASAAEVLVSYEPVAVGDLVRILPENYKR